MKNLLNEAYNESKFGGKKESKDWGKEQKKRRKVPCIAQGLILSSKSISSQLKIRESRKEENKQWFSLNWCDIPLWNLAIKNVIIYLMMRISKDKHLIEMD